MLATLIERFRRRIAEVADADPVTEDMLIGMTATLEQAHWMWQAKTA